MIVILYDGECSFCSATIQFVLKRDREELFHFAAIQSEAGSHLLRDHGVEEPGLDTIYLLEGGRIFERSTASLLIGKRLPRYRLISTLSLWVPRVVRDWCYNWVARNRYRLGDGERCQLPAEGQRARFLDLRD